MKISRILVVASFLLTLMSAFAIDGPVAAAPSSATSFAAARVASDGSTNWRHHQHRHHRHGGGIIIRL